MEELPRPVSSQTAAGTGVSMATQGCHLPSGWNMLDAAPAYSAFAGILAGFLFLAVVTLMTGRRYPARTATKSAGRSSALMLFLPALLSLVISSFLFGEVSGDQVCARGFVGGIFASSFLGIGALGGFTGIVWMLEAHSVPDRDLRRASIAFIYISYFIVVASLVAECIDIIDNAFQNNPPGYAIGPLIGYGPALIAAIVATRKWFMPDDDNYPRAQLAAVYVPYAYVVIAGITLATLNLFHPAEWRSLHDWKVYVTLGVALFFPAATVIAYARSLPSMRDR
jgi:hypothetical protein